MSKHKIGSCLLAIMAVLSLVVGGAAAATEELADPTVSYNGEDDVEVKIEWNDSIDDTSTSSADITFYAEDAYEIDGNETDTADYDGTLSGTTFTMTAEPTDNATYAVELDSSNETVDVGAADFTRQTDSDGNDIDEWDVDLSNHTDTTLTADDSVLSVTTTADVITSDTIDAIEGGTTVSAYNADDGLEDGESYRLIVEGDDTEIDDVSIYDGVDDPLAGYTDADGSPGFGAALGGVVVAFVAICAAVFAKNQSGGY